jgi:serine/threonine protein kinase
MDYMTRPVSEDNAVFAGPPHDPNRYRVGNTVGMGGEGEVARGILDVHGAPVDVAIKIWRHPRDDVGGLRARAKTWESQVHLVQSIQHPGIVRVREAFIGSPPHYVDQPRRPGEVLYLVMNWAEGVPLSRWIVDHRAATYDDVCTIVTAIAGAVAHLHSGRDTGGQPILHRDLKPSNVILSVEGHVQIVDFGLARGTSRAPDAGGTPGYLAPEVALEGAFSTASDMFGLGALTYFLVVGQNPPDQRPDQYSVEPVRAALARAPMLKDQRELIEHLVTAMAARPEDRPTNPVGWAGGLQNNSTSHVAADDPLPPPAPTTPPAARSTVRRRTRTALVVVGLTALIIASPLVWVAVRRSLEGTRDRGAAGPPRSAVVGPGVEGAMVDLPTAGTPGSDTGASTASAPTGGPPTSTAAGAVTRNGNGSGGKVTLSSATNGQPGVTSTRGVAPTTTRAVTTRPAPTTGPPAKVAVPRLISPTDHEVRSNFPRTTTFTWAAVPNASEYLAEVEYWSSAAGVGWTDLDHLRTSATAWTFDFVGAQPGRWRVTAFSGARSSSASEWRYFDYTI